jgi:thiosulfate dehydrogenase (quinone) large subunit
MTILFAYIASLSGTKDWPVRLIYGTEAAFVATAIICFMLGLFLGSSRPVVRDAVTIAGGIGAGFGLVMPFELAPLFFHVNGEIMMVSILLIFAYPLAVAFFIWLFRTMMPSENGVPIIRPPELPED